MAIFVIITYSWAYKVKGDKMLLTRVNVIDAFPKYGLAWQTSYFGLFSPSSRRYDIRLAEENDLIRGLEIPAISAALPSASQETPLTLVQDGEGGLAYTEGAYIHIWSEEHFQTEGAVQIPGMAVAENVTFSVSHLIGNLDLSLNYSLENPWLFYFTRGGYATNRLTLGEDTELSNGNYPFDIFLDIRNQFPNLGTQDVTGLSAKEIELRNIAIDILEARRVKNSPMNEIVLAGFISGETVRALESPNVRAVREQSLVLVHIPLRDVNGTFEIENASYHIVGIDATDFAIRENGDLQLTDGEMLYCVTFPPVDDPANIPESLDMTVGAGKSGGLFSFWAFDHELNIWSPLPRKRQSGYVLTLELSRVSRFLAPDGRTLFIRIGGNPNVDEDVISLNGILIDE